MAKDKSDAEKKARKEEKRKRKLSEAATVDEVEEPVAKKEKKDKKKSKDVAVEDSVMDIDATLNGDDEDEDKKVVAAGDVALAALVPFANPLADDKQQKKVLKGVKKGKRTMLCANLLRAGVEMMNITDGCISAAKHKTLKRGVKECVKAIRKSPIATPTTLASSAPPPGIVVLAADISPMDVISHIPVLCEDHNLPYLFVPSRAELGAAGSTKRPTSVVMISANKGGKKKDGEEDGEEWAEAYNDLWKLAIKMGQTVKV
jgi:H/ACA ribonucleoprotein complex subunit 2